MSSTDQGLLHSWVKTTWSKIFQGRGDDGAAQQARNELLVRYHEAVYHYFLRQIRDPHVAQELYSNFALRLIETDALLKRADPQRGRFRNYLKTALHHMIVDHYRRVRRRREDEVLVDDEGGNIDVADRAADATFDPIWRQELLNQAWKALEAAEKQGGQPHYTVLRFQSDNPGLKGPDLAARLTEKLGKETSYENARMLLHRARKRFAALLLEEVERSLETPTPDDLEQELIDLKLLEICKQALEKRREPG
jgi:RNA polymerase sigma-70 factor (ECF subfamily)